MFSVCPLVCACVCNCIGQRHFPTGLPSTVVITVLGVIVITSLVQYLLMTMIYAARQRRN